MGATPWHEMGSWHDDPRESLRLLQARFLAADYDLPSLIVTHAAFAKQNVELTEAQGDRYGLLAPYKQQLEVMEQISRAPLPADAQGQVEIVRKIYGSSGEGIGNVLDLVSASPIGSPFVARILNDSELRDLFGTVKPTRQVAETVLARLSSGIGRGDSVCLPVFSDDGEPVGWWFAGYTVD